MKICYLDECGHCGEKPNPKQPVETVCGVVTDLTKVFKTQKEHGDVLDILTNLGVDISELKSSEIYRGRNEWSNADHELRDRVFTVLLEWAMERKCKFIPCPIDSIAFFYRKQSGCLICNKLQFPFEAAALNAILALQREFANSKNNKGKTVVIFDEQKKHDERLLRLLENDLSFTDGFTGYIKPPRAKGKPRLDQIIDVPHFSKSHLAVLIQIADIGAFVMNRYLDLMCVKSPEKYDGEIEKIMSWYSLMSSNMVKHTSIDPPAKDDLSKFYKSMRPNGWTAKKMTSIKKG